MSNSTYEALLAVATLNLLTQINTAEAFRMGMLSKEEYIAYLKDTNADLLKTEECLREKGVI